MGVCRDIVRVADDINVTSAVYSSLTLAETTSSVYGEHRVLSTIFWMISTLCFSLTKTMGATMLGRVTFAYIDTLFQGSNST